MFFSGAFHRRRLLQGLLTVFFSALFAPIARAEKAAVRRPIVRISRGSFPPESYDQIRQRLDAAQESLIPAIRQLAGCLHYFAAIDRESSSMVNVSVWRSLSDAQQMQTLAPMLALAEAFAREGVSFERPVINYETVWEIDR
jgi:quinol monooxygenase YgiN